MPVAEILSIGTELLLGEIQDTNTRFIARRLRDVGIDLFRTSMVGDNADRIALAISEALQRADFVITTGGLGPTIDDPTRQAVAMAAGVDLEYHPELWDQILDRFRKYSREPSENNRRQAFIPRGSCALENGVGTAPSFITTIRGRHVISLPGVPREMEWALEQHVFPFLRQTYNLNGTIKARILHLSGVGESQVDEWISDLELLSNPTVGLAAHTGQVDIRITAKASTQEEAVALIAQVEADLRSRVEKHIYGVDQQTLAGVIIEKITRGQFKLAVVDCGSGGELTRRLAEAGFDPAFSQVIHEPETDLDLPMALTAQMTSTCAQVGLASSYQPGTDRQELNMLVVSPTGRFSTTRSYGGPPTNGVVWSVNTSLDALWRNI